MAASVTKERNAEPLSRWMLLPSGIDPARVDAADKILKMGNVAVCKSTRAGFTTSAVVAAERKGLKTLVIAPTNNILNKTVRETVERMGGKPCGIPGNHVCKYIQEIIHDDPILEQLPIMMNEKCEDCEEYDTCALTELERIGDFTTATITYAKLEAVMLSSSDSAEFIRSRLSDVDLVILDESHLLSFPSLPQVDFGKIILIPEKYGALRHMMDAWYELCSGDNEGIARTIRFYTDQDPMMFTGYHVSTNFRHDWYEQLKTWGELIDLAENRSEYKSLISDNDILALRDIIAIICGSTATISYLRTNDLERMVVSGCQGRDHFALWQFLTEVAPKAQVVFVSGTLVERHPGFFSDLSGREIETVIFPDLNDTNSKMFLHPSTWKFSSTKGGKREIEHAVKEIREISESNGHQPIYLLAMNTRYAAELTKELKDLPNIKVDYYKSANSIGIEQKERICIAVGAAEIPRHACDPLAEGRNDDERFFDSQQLRINAVDCATWQAISRVKDPDGKVESHVFFVGVRAEQVSRIATWGTKREVNAEFDENGAIKASAHCVEYLGRPNIVMEERSDLRPCRRSVSDYVDAVVPISEVISARQKSYTFPYNYIIGETVRFSDEPLRLYNRPMTSEQFERNFFSLATLFVTRIDKCGLQNKQPNYKGKFGYYTGAPPKSFKDLLDDHLFDCETIAQPPFDLDDNCHYCAVDFDDHDGNTPQSENVKMLTGFLKKREIPCVVVKSGSNDGYHVFLPIVPTKTSVANRFLKQLVKDVGLEGHKEIERYPKQKSIKSSKGGYGNQIKLPLGFNWKAGKKSAVVDPYTLEPVEFIEVTHAIKLRDLPEPVVKKSKRTLSAPSSQTTGSYPSGEMRDCIRGVIDSRVPLDDGEGHAMRVAIAVEAHRCGLSEEATVDLFKGQDDFDEGITSRSVRYIRDKNYKRYGCEKLQDQCSSLVKGYCEKCPSSNGGFK